MCDDDHERFMVYGDDLLWSVVVFLGPARSKKSVVRSLNYSRGIYYDGEVVGESRQAVR